MQHMWVKIPGVCLISIEENWLKQAEGIEIGGKAGKNKFRSCARANMGQIQQNNFKNLGSLLLVA